MTKLYILAVENSGDQLGAGLISSVKSLNPDMEMRGHGGSAMKALGVSGEIDLSPLAILGFVEALKVYPIVLDRVQRICDDIMACNVDAVVLIDSWGFMIRVAKALKKRGYTGKVVKYVAPQVWAMREGRAKILAKYVDHLLTLHNFDAPYFKKHGLDVSYVGNPVFDIDYAQGHGADLRNEYGIHPDERVVSVYFGSRLSEIQRLATPFADAIENIKRDFPSTHFISPVSDTIATDVAAAAGADLRLQDVILLPEPRKFDVFAASDMALACSGTITTQLACAGVPCVVGYKLDPLTFTLARRLYKPNHVSIVNIAAGQALMPEFVQNDCNGESLSEALRPYLETPQAIKQAKAALLRQIQIMKGKGGSANTRAAKALLSIISDP